MTSIQRNAYTATVKRNSTEVIPTSDITAQTVVADGFTLSQTDHAGTTARAYQYNHLGQLTQVTDDAGTRTIGYNSYGEQETDSLLANGVTHLITETRDGYGRSTGYTYAKNGVVLQTVTTGYGTDGRIVTAGFLHSGAEKQFGYSYLESSDLLQSLTMPNNIGEVYGSNGYVRTAYTYTPYGSALFMLGLGLCF